MTIKVNGENRFQVPATSFGISPSNEGYTLQYSANGEDFTSYDDATPAGENLVVHTAKNLYYYLQGNGSDVTVSF